MKRFLNELTDLKFSEEALKYIATRTNQFRKLVQHIDQIEKLASTNQLEVIDEQLVKGILNERSNIKVMQKVEKNVRLMKFYNLWKYSRRFWNLLLCI